MRRVVDAREGSEFPNLSEHSQFFHYASLIDNTDSLRINLIAMNYKVSGRG